MARVFLRELEGLCFFCVVSRAARLVCSDAALNGSVLSTGCWNTAQRFSSLDIRVSTLHSASLWLPGTPLRMVSTSYKVKTILLFEEKVGVTFLSRLDSLSCAKNFVLIETITSRASRTLSYYIPCRVLTSRGQFLRPCIMHVEIIYSLEKQCKSEHVIIPWH